MTIMNKLGRQVVVSEFIRLMAELDNENTVTHLVVKGKFDIAFTEGQRASNGLDKLENYAKIFGLERLSKQEAIIALHGTIPNDPQYDFSHVEHLLSYLLKGSERARQLVDCKSRNKANNTELLSQAVTALFKDKPLDAEFGWSDVREVLATEFKQSKEQIESLHSSFSVTSFAKRSWNKVAGTHRDTTKWHLTDIMKEVLNKKALPKTELHAE